MPEPEDTATPSAQAAPTPAEALADARLHALRGLGEMILAARALLDAASLAMNHQPASDSALFAPLAEMLEEWAQTLGHRGDMGPLILDALEAEIRRFEARSVDDEEARLVLRAFLGLREFLWELGVRPSAKETGSASDGYASQATTDPLADAPKPGSPTSC